MTGEHLLLLIAITAGMSAVTAFRRGAKSFALLNGGFFAAAAVCYFVAPPSAGFWLVGPYALFVVAPILATLQVNRSIAARKLRRAALFARLAFALHPSPDNRRFIELVRVHELLGRDDVDGAIAILRELGMQEDMELELLRLQSRWDEVIDHIETSERDPFEKGTAVLYVRALGEAQRIDRMVEVYRTAVERWAKRDDMQEELATARLFVAAFLGQVAIVETICEGTLKQYSDSIKLYWQATAHAVGGDRERAAAAWEQLRQDEEPRMRGAAEYRVERPPLRVDVPSEPLRAVIAELERDVRETATYAGHTPAHAPRAVLSYAFAGLIVVMQVVVWLQREQGSTELWNKGVFYSPFVLEEGEWWRIFTAAFLHAGWMHVAMNALGLIWFGPFVERFLGRVRFAIVYLIGAIGGFALLTALDYFDLRDASAAVGASGGVMALIGASTAIFLRGRERSPLAASRLRDMLVFVAMQVVFDLLAPQISLTGHLAGLAIGFLLARISRRARA